MKNIILIGLSGSGKTTLGAAAALGFGLDFCDMDAEIEKKSGKSISEIFTEFGESYFRELETAESLRAAGMNKTVISTGGGIVLREEGICALKESGLAIYIDRPPELIAGEIDIENRPLLFSGAERLIEMDRERRCLYEKYAHAVLVNDGTEEAALQRLKMLIRSEYPDSGFGVIGDPISHSMSPQIHNSLFSEHKSKGLLAGKHWSYEAIQVPEGRLKAFVDAAKLSGMGGFNVTMPHKQAIIPLLDEIDEDAAMCGAVNTVVIKGGRLVGYNTDMEGLLMALKEKGLSYRNKAITVLGAGGAAAGIALKASREGAAVIRILSRRKEQAATLADRITCMSTCASDRIPDKTACASDRTPAKTACASDRAPDKTAYETGRIPDKTACASDRTPAKTAYETGRIPDKTACSTDRAPDKTARTTECVEAYEMNPSELQTVAKKTDILINATPLGMAGCGQFEDLDFITELPKTAAVCDLVYNPALTELLDEACNAGLEVINGRGMLMFQASLANRLFTGTLADEQKPVCNVLTKRD